MFPYNMPGNPNVIMQRSMSNFFEVLPPNVAWQQSHFQLVIPGQPFLLPSPLPIVQNGGHRFFGGPSIAAPQHVRPLYAHMNSPQLLTGMPISFSGPQTTLPLMEPQTNIAPPHSVDNQTATLNEIGRSPCTPSSHQIYQRQPPDHAMTEWRDSPRYWQFYDNEKKRPTGTMRISVMTYNILAQSLLEENPYLYYDCEGQYLNWSFRGPALMKQLEHHMSDIVCLQEVQETHWKSFLQPKLASLGYEGYFIKRSGDKPDGCAILFKHKKFKLIEYVPVHFKKTGILDRDNVGAILLLKPRKKFYRGRVPKICVATTHLLFNPKRGDVKLAQLMLFLAEIEKCSYTAPGLKTDQMASTSAQPCGRKEEMTNNASDHPYCPIIFCGDLNLEPESGLFDFIKNGHIHYEGCISQELSGQRERAGGYTYLPTNLLSKSLGINDHCQYIEHALNRLSINVSSANKSCDESSLKEEAKTDNAISNDRVNKASAINTGHAFHNFNFKSVYPHHLNLVTTHHGRASCMVDYIFYSCGETICDINYETTNAISGESRSKKKKRKRSESANYEKQPSTTSAYKTLRGECEYIASSVKSDIKKQEPSGNAGFSQRSKLLMVKDNAPHNSKSHTNHVGAHNTDNLEPGEILSSGDLEDSKLDGKNGHASDCYSDFDLMIVESSNTEKDNLSEPNFPPRHATNSEKYVSVQSLELIGCWSLLSHREFNRIGALPNKIFPSDHICLIAKFLLH